MCKFIATVVTRAPSLGTVRCELKSGVNERGISLEEVGETVNEMKSGKAALLDGFPVECLKKGGVAVLEY